MADREKKEEKKKIQKFEYPCGLERSGDKLKTLHLH